MKKNNGKSLAATVLAATFATGACAEVIPFDTTIQQQQHGGGGEVFIVDVDLRPSDAMVIAETWDGTNDRGIPLHTEISLTTHFDWNDPLHLSGGGEVSVFASSGLDPSASNAGVGASISGVSFFRAGFTLTSAYYATFSSETCCGAGSLWFSGPSGFFDNNNGDRRTFSILLQPGAYGVTASLAQSAFSQPTGGTNSRSGFYDFDIQLTPVPLPAAFWLLCSGLGALQLKRRR